MVHMFYTIVCGQIKGLSESWLASQGCISQVASAYIVIIVTSHEQVVQYIIATHLLAGVYGLLTSAPGGAL